MIPSKPKGGLMAAMGPKDEPPAQDGDMADVEGDPGDPIADIRAAIADLTSAVDRLSPPETKPSK